MSEEKEIPQIPLKYQQRLMRSKTEVLLGRERVKALEAAEETAKARREAAEMHVTYHQSLFNDAAEDAAEACGLEPKEYTVKAVGETVFFSKRTPKERPNGEDRNPDQESDSLQ